MTDINSIQQQLAEIAKEVYSCPKCPLHMTRNKPLVGDGNQNADIMIIGEAPGYHEDKKGKAFIGKAGEILDNLLDHVHLSRKEVYITNVLKCHPPRNHDPTTNQINACLDYLFRQIKIIKPKIIMTLGSFATKAMFNKVSLPFSSTREVHGRIFEIKSSYGLMKIIPQYHPAAACYGTTKSCNVSLFDTMRRDFEKTIGELLR